MAHVLYLTQVLPYPLNTGARVRQYYVLRYLSQHHTVTLVSFVREDDRPEHIEHLKSICAAVYPMPMLRSRWRDLRAVVKSVLTRLPIIIARDEIKPMNDLLARLVAEQPFDVIHADQVSMSQYGLAGGQARRVLDLHNAMYVVTERLAANEPNPLKRMVLRREARALSRYEARLCVQYDQVTFVTNEDRDLIQRQIERHHVQLPADRFTTIPICIDPGDKLPIVPVARPFRILSLGVMFWPPNAEGALWFARDMWPRIQARHPELVFTIAGKNPPEYLRQLHGQNNIEVLGYVPDLNQVLAETAAFIVPLRAGGGMRVKILDTWCWGLPVVSTRIGAEGIQVCAGDNILLADEADAFAEAVLQLVEDASLNQQLRECGRRWVEENYDWRRIYTAWDEVYSGLTQI